MERTGVTNQEIPHVVAPGHREAAVLSGLSVREKERWKVIAGSLLTVPADVAQMSWPAWKQEQPETRSPGSRPMAGPDLGARFLEEPFDGIQIFRLPVARAEWDRRVEEMEGGLVPTPRLSTY